MLIKGCRVPSNQGVVRQRLAAHLVKTQGELGERQVVPEITMHRVGDTGTTQFESVYDAIADLSARGTGLRSNATLLHCSLSPDRAQTPEQWQGSWRIYEKIHGLEGHAYVSVVHDKEGRERHEHRVYDLTKIDPETGNMTLVNMKGDFFKNQAIARIIEWETGAKEGLHDLTPVLASHKNRVCDILREHGYAEIAAAVEAAPPAKRARLSQLEAQQQQRSGISLAATHGTIGRAWAAATSPADFLARLDAAGLILAKGDLVLGEDANKAEIRPWVVVDPCNPHTPVSIGLMRAINAHASLLGGSKPDQNELIAAITERLGGLTLPYVSTVIEDVRQNAYIDQIATRQALAEQIDFSASIEPDRMITAKKTPEKPLPPTPLAYCEAKSSTFTDAELRATCLRYATRDSGPGADPAAIRARARDLYSEAVADKQLCTVSAMGEPRRYSTATMIRAEADIVRIVTEAKNDKRFVFDRSKAEIAAEYAKWREGFRLKIGKPDADLNAEQGVTLDHVLTGRRNSVISGVAGAGKTTMIDAARHIWESQGLMVYGCSISAKAASGLKDAGVRQTDSIFSTIRDATLALAALDAKTKPGWLGTNLSRKFEHQGDPTKPPAETSIRDILLEQCKRSLAADPRGKYADLHRRRITYLTDSSPMPRRVTAPMTKWVREELDKMIQKSPLVAAGYGKAVLIVDEFGMVGTLDGAKLHRICEAIGAKFCGMGDQQQLSSVNAGSAMAISVAVEEPAKLIAVTRQDSEEERRASQLFAQGTEADARAALEIYRDRGKLHIVGGKLGEDEAVTQAGEQMGRELTADEAKTVTLISAYLDAKAAERELWATELARLSPEERQTSPHWAAYCEAQKAWKDAARSLPVAPYGVEFLARYGIDPVAFSLDYLQAQGKSYTRAKAMAAETADALALKNAVPFGDPQRLTIDLRRFAREAIISSWAEKERDHRWLAAIVQAQGGEPPKPRSSLLLAFRRDDVAKLNDAAHAEMVKNGWLGSLYEVTTADHGTLALGKNSRIQLYKNEKGTELRNGVFGTVLTVGRDSDTNGIVLVTRLDNGTVINIDTSKFRDFGHGYAATIHKSQGVTVSDCAMLADRLITRSLAYVGMSRHRADVEMYAAKSDFASIGQLIDKLAQGKLPDLVSDFAALADLMTNKNLSTETAADRSAALLSTVTEEDFRNDKLKAYAKGPQAGEGTAAAQSDPGQRATGSDRSAGTGAGTWAGSVAAFAEFAPAGGEQMRNLSEVGLVHDLESEQDQGLLRDLPPDNLAVGQGGLERDHGLRRSDTLAEWQKGLLSHDYETAKSAENVVAMEKHFRDYESVIIERSPDGTFSVSTHDADHGETVWIDHPMPFDQAFAVAERLAAGSTANDLIAENVIPANSVSVATRPNAPLPDPDTIFDYIAEPVPDGPDHGQAASPSEVESPAPNLVESPAPNLVESPPHSPAAAEGIPSARDPDFDWRKHFQQADRHGWRAAERADFTPRRDDAGIITWTRAGSDIEIQKQPNVAGWTLRIVPGDGSTATVDQPVSLSQAVALSERLHAGETLADLAAAGSIDEFRIIRHGPAHEQPIAENQPVVLDVIPPASTPPVAPLQTSLFDAIPAKPENQAVVPDGRAELGSPAKSDQPQSLTDFLAAENRLATSPPAEHPAAYAVLCQQAAIVVADHGARARLHPQDMEWLTDLAAEHERALAAKEQQPKPPEQLVLTVKAALDRFEHSATSLHQEAAYHALGRAAVPVIENPAAKALLEPEIAPIVEQAAKDAKALAENERRERQQAEIERALQQNRQRTMRPR